MSQPLTVRGLSLWPPLALAPMVGLSHSALRSLILELGGASFFFTEMLSVGRLPSESALSPYLVKSVEERPLFYQLFAGPRQDVRPAVDRIHTLDAQGIDLNLGCPAPNLKRLGAGCALVEDLAETQRLVRTVRTATPLPLSAKIRLGRVLDGERLREFCRMLEGEGVDLLTVHGRLDGDKFCRRPRWDWIGTIKEMLTIPVLANGGIFSVADAKSCLEQSGADGLMIGRGGACRPWLFREIAEALYGYPPSSADVDRERLYFRFVELLEERFRPERRLGRLKQFTRYYGDNYKFGHQLTMAVQRSNSLEEAVAQAEAFFAGSTEEYSTGRTR